MKKYRNVIEKSIENPENVIYKILKITEPGAIYDVKAIINDKNVRDETVVFLFKFRKIYANLADKIISKRVNLLKNIGSFNVQLSYEDRLSIRYLKRLKEKNIISGYGQNRFGFIYVALLKQRHDSDYCKTRQRFNSGPCIKRSQLDLPGELPPKSRSKSSISTISLTDSLWYSLDCINDEGLSGSDREYIVLNSPFHDTKLESANEFRQLVNRKNVYVYQNSETRKYQIGFIKDSDDENLYFSEDYHKVDRNLENSFSKINLGSSKRCNTNPSLSRASYSSMLLQQQTNTTSVESENGDSEDFKASKTKSESPTKSKSDSDQKDESTAKLHSQYYTVLPGYPLYIDPKTAIRQPYMIHYPIINGRIYPMATLPEQCEKDISMAPLLMPQYYPAQSPRIPFQPYPLTPIQLASLPPIYKQGLPIYKHNSDSKSTPQKFPEPQQYPIHYPHQYTYPNQIKNQMSAFEVINKPKLQTENLEDKLYTSSKSPVINENAKKLLVSNTEKLTPLAKSSSESSDDSMKSILSRINYSYNTGGKDGKETKFFNLLNSQAKELKNENTTEESFIEQIWQKEQRQIAQNEWSNLEKNSNGKENEDDSKLFKYITKYDKDSYHHIHEKLSINIPGLVQIQTKSSNIAPISQPQNSRNLKSVINPYEEIYKNNKY